MADLTPDTLSHAMLSGISEPFRRICEAVAGELRHGDPAKAYALVDGLLREKRMGPTDRRCMIALRVAVRALRGLRAAGIGPELDLMHTIGERLSDERFHRMVELAERSRPAVARAFGNGDDRAVPCPNCGGSGEAVGWARAVKRSGTAHARFYLDVPELVAQALPDEPVSPAEAHILVTLALADIDARVAVRQCGSCRLRYVARSQDPGRVEEVYSAPMGGGFELAGERAEGRANVLGFAYLKAALPLHLEALLGDLRGRAVYEFGCAEGVMAAVLADLGAVVIGGDLDRPKVRYGRLALGLQGLSDEPDAFWSVPEASQDGIVAFHTVEHLLDPDRFLARFRRMLRPGGWLAVSVPRTSVNEVGEVAEMGGDHLIGFDEGILTGFLEHNGFEIVDVQVDDGALPPDRVDAVLRAPLWAGRSADVTIVARRPV